MRKRLCQGPAPNRLDPETVADTNLDLDSSLDNDRDTKLDIGADLDIDVGTDSDHSHAPATYQLFSCEWKRGQQLLGNFQSNRRNFTLHLELGFRLPARRPDALYHGGDQRHTLCQRYVFIQHHRQ